MNIGNVSREVRMRHKTSQVKSRKSREQERRVKGHERWILGTEGRRYNEKWEMRGGGVE